MKSRTQKEIELRLKFLAINEEILKLENSMEDQQRNGEITDPQNCALLDTKRKTLQKVQRAIRLLDQEDGNTVDSTTTSAHDSTGVESDSDSGASSHALVPSSVDVRVTRDHGAPTPSHNAKAQFSSVSASTSSKCSPHTHGIDQSRTPSPGVPESSIEKEQGRAVSSKRLKIHIHDIANQKPRSVRSKRTLGVQAKGSRVVAHESTESVTPSDTESLSSALPSPSRSPYALQTSYPGWRVFLTGISKFFQLVRLCTLISDILLALWANMSQKERCLVSRLCALLVVVWAIKYLLPENSAYGWLHSSSIWLSSAFPALFCTWTPVTYFPICPNYKFARDRLSNDLCRLPLSTIVGNCNISATVLDDLNSPFSHFDKLTPMYAGLVNETAALRPVHIALKDSVGNAFEMREIFAGNPQIPHSSDLASHYDTLAHTYFKAGRSLQGFLFKVQGNLNVQRYFFTRLFRQLDEFRIAEASQNLA